MDLGMYDHVKVEMEDYVDDKFNVIVRTLSMNRLLEPRTYTMCHGFEFYVLINAKGDVVPCNVFYNKPDYVYGNINESSIGDIWQSAKRLRISQKIAWEDFKHCGDYRCRLDVMNRYLHRVKNPERNDVFI